MKFKILSRLKIYTRIHLYITLVVVQLPTYLERCITKKAIEDNKTTFSVILRDSSNHTEYRAKSQPLDNQGRAWHLARLWALLLCLGCASSPAWLLCSNNSKNNSNNNNNSQKTQKLSRIPLDPHNTLITKC